MAEWIPLLQTGLWVTLIVILVILFWNPLNLLLKVSVERVHAGASFSIGPFEVGTTPPSIARTTEVAWATAEGRNGSSVPPSVRALLEAKQYSEGIREDVYLVHAARVLRERTTAGSGRYRVRVWLEAYDADVLASIKRVTFRLYDDFKPLNVVATEAREKEFELWLNVYGEFNIVAFAERTDGAGLWLTRYIDLPGRPPE